VVRVPIPFSHRGSPLPIGVGFVWHQFLPGGKSVRYPIGLATHDIDEPIHKGA
jgi:hypothetical protein